MQKINILRIVVDHFLTLRDYRTKKLSAGDITVFFAVPLILVAYAVFRGVRFDENILNALLMAFSIFAGLLFSLLLLIFSFSERNQYGVTLESARKKLFRELQTNISFAILVSIAIVVIALIAVVRLKDGHPVQDLPESFTTGLLILLTANFVLTILMILKRMYAVLSQASETLFKKSA